MKRISERVKTSGLHASAILSIMHHLVKSDEDAVVIHILFEGSLRHPPALLARNPPDFGNCPEASPTCASPSPFPTCSCNQNDDADAGSEEAEVGAAFSFLRLSIAIFLRFILQRPSQLGFHL
jgi:hypothetical protein